MKTMFAAFASALLIAVIAQVAYDNAGFSSAERQAASSVRLN
ncbi:MAG: hypothetical protein WBA02_07195 [Jannaschia helgolandensis]|jgi:hypothetical protein|uniref:Uncharacterized protein n=1 Tax=Jannaschia helgolandensis TaxID=188906 RepID=A0A1H7GXF7_9RHOB|nr:hypothetical protein [Jannaschia helgolandensis]SEK42833.1 hypothetical protein SAMN04488526_0552 [Jannaschia helgolandensis]|tara:strand:+ start:3414 stop:3539 length:126 start_codon:yes stop_codon:yes gene_type:complete